MELKIKDLEDVKESVDKFNAGTVALAKYLELLSDDWETMSKSLNELSTEVLKLKHENNLLKTELSKMKLEESIRLNKVIVPGQSIVEMVNTEEMADEESEGNQRVFICDMYDMLRGKLGK